MGLRGVLIWPPLWVGLSFSTPGYFSQEGESAWLSFYLGVLEVHVWQSQAWQVTAWRVISTIWWAFLMFSKNSSVPITGQ